MTDPLPRPANDPSPRTSTDPLSRASSDPSPRPSSAPAGVIDTHAHVYPHWYLDELERIGVPERTTAIARLPGADSSPQDLATRWEDMDRAGVDMQILAATPQVPAAPDAQDSARAARAINDHYAQLVAEHPGRLRAYGVLPLPHVRESLTEAQRLLDLDGFLGVSLTAVAGDPSWSLAGSDLDPLWTLLDARSAVVNIHPTGYGAHSPLLQDHHLEWVNGAPVEDATAVLHLLRADVPRRFPNVRFHIAHLGGDLPFLAQRLEDNYEDWGTFPSSPRAALRGMWFDAANFHAPSLVLARDTVGPDRILAGSDQPYFQGDKYVRAFSSIRSAPLAADEIDAILRRNPQDLYS